MQFHSSQCSFNLRLFFPHHCHHHHITAIVIVLLTNCCHHCCHHHHISITATALSPFLLLPSELPSLLPLHRCHHCCHHCFHHHPYYDLLPLPLMLSIIAIDVILLSLPSHCCCCYHVAAIIAFVYHHLTSRGPSLPSHHEPPLSLLCIFLRHCNLKAKLGFGGPAVLMPAIECSIFALLFLCM